MINLKSQKYPIRNFLKMTDANKNWYTHFLLFHKFCDMQKKKKGYTLST